MGKRDTRKNWARDDGQQVPKFNRNMAISPSIGIYSVVRLTFSSIGDGFFTALKETGAIYLYLST